MIVKNEERWLEKCLASVEGVVDEIIIVDSQSQDRTLAIAESHNAKVIQHRWQNDFALARNISIDHATGDWVLVLDADEELDARTRAQIRQVIEGDVADGYKLCQRSFLPADELQKYDDLHITRLFRNRPEYRYEQPTHEQILPSIERHGGKVITTDMIILHYGYAEPTVQGDQSRVKRNLHYLELALAQYPDDPYYHYQIGATYKALGEARRAYASLQRALELDCRYLGAETLDRLYMKLAQLALQFNDYKQAIIYANDSLSINPTNVTSMYVAALAHIFQGDIEKAYKLFRSIRLHPNISLSSKNDLDAVLAYCRTVLEKP